MTPIELRAARETLGLTLEEAAEHIGGVTRRSWVYFESGDRTIKADIADKITALLARRREVLQAVQQKMLHESAEMAGMAVIYYPTPEHCQSVLDWRFSQSLARELAATHGAKLVKFDPAAYAEWLALGNNIDNEQHRAMWAAQQ